MKTKTATAEAVEKARVKAPASTDDVDAQAVERAPAPADDADKKAVVLPPARFEMRPVKLILRDTRQPVDCRRLVGAFAADGNQQTTIS
jgi:hypothetical protein